MYLLVKTIMEVLFNKVKNGIQDLHYSRSRYFILCETRVVCCGTKKKKNLCNKNAFYYEKCKNLIELTVVVSITKRKKKKQLK